MNQLAVGTAINSFLIQGTSSRTIGTTPSNDATVYLSKVSMELANSPLPVSLTSFTGELKNNSIALNWQTVSETNNSHFEILKFSSNNQTPVKIGEVAGHENSTSIKNYAFEDKNPYAGINYYQLRQVDLDGKFSLSKMVSVNAGLNDAQFQVYQTNNNNCEVNLFSERTESAVLTLLDLNGRMLNQLNTVLEQGNNTITISNKALTPGVYVAQLKVNGSQLSQKFIVN